MVDIEIAAGLDTVAGSTWMAISIPIPIPTLPGEQRCRGKVDMGTRERRIRNLAIIPLTDRPGNCNMAGAA